MRKLPLQTEVSLTNLNVVFPGVTSTWFTELLPRLLFLKMTQPKGISTPRGHSLSWRTLLPATGGQGGGGGSHRWGRCGGRGLAERVPRQSAEGPGSLCRRGVRQGCWGASAGTLRLGGQVRAPVGGRPSGKGGYCGLLGWEELGGRVFLKNIW